MRRIVKRRGAVNKRVNFVLGTGLHSYGFGGGGQSYMAAIIALQFLYVGAAALRVVAAR